MARLGHRAAGGRRPVTDPAAHGGTAEDAFDLVLPSLPGYGFSGEPAETGWDPGRIARTWVELMDRLGYTRYVAQGGDQGAAVTDAMGRQAPAGLAGIHLNFLREALGNVGGLPADSGEERAALAAMNTFRTSGSGYFLEQATRPQTIGYALLDSPVALAAWMLDHDTDSYYTIEQMTRDAIAFITAKELGEADLLGFSIGSFVAQQIALVRPAIVRRLVLASSAPQGAAGRHGWAPEVIGAIGTPKTSPEAYLDVFSPGQRPAAEQARKPCGACPQGLRTGMRQRRGRHAKPNMMGLLLGDSQSWAAPAADCPRHAGVRDERR